MALFGDLQRDSLHPGRTTMAGFRLPGPLNQLERFLDVQDGTTTSSAMSWAGPLGHPGNWTFTGIAPASSAERQALIVENSALWEQILSGKLERVGALRKLYADAEDNFALGMNTLLAPALLKTMQAEVPPYVHIERPEQALEYDPTLRRSQYVLQALFEIYDQQCQNEFSKLNPSLKPSFNNPIDYMGISFPEPWQYYQWLRPYYYRAGIVDPVTALNEIDSATFLGHPVIGGVNQRLRKILEEAENELDKMGAKDDVAKSIKSVGGFVPRPINSPKGMIDLSNHALGQAIDIDPATNPDIQGIAAKDVDEVLNYLKVPYRFRESFLEAQDIAQKPEAQAEIARGKVEAISHAIQKFLATWLDEWEEWETKRQRDELKLKELEKAEDQQRAKRDKSIGMEKSYVAFQAASKQYRDAQLETWEQKKQIDKDGAEFTQNEQPFVYVEILVNALGGISQARLYRDKGLVTLPLQLFIAMKKAGARSGIEYEKKKDIMHFEVPPHDKKGK
jgi:hypothetical protein